MKLDEKLVEISVRGQARAWSRKDQERTRQILSEEGAEADAGSWVNKLFNPKDVRTLTGPVAAARAWVRDNALPSPNGRGRFWVPVEKVPEFRDKLAGFKLEIDEAVRVFVLNYDVMLAGAEEFRGHLFNRDEYPSDGDALYGMYDLVWRFHTLQTPDEIQRVFDDINGGLRAQIEDELQADQKRAQAEHRRILADAMIEPLREMVKKLADLDKGSQGFVRQSVAENIAAAIRRVKDFNYFDDPVLDKFVTKVEASALAEAPAPLLSKSAGMRKIVSDKARDLAAEMEKAFAA